MSLMHLHRPEIRMLTASNRKAQVLNSRRVDGLSAEQVDQILPS
jgi:hypothetical protein